MSNDKNNPLIMGMTPMVFLSICDRLITGVFSMIKALQTEDAEVQAKKDELIMKLKLLPDFEEPVTPEPE